MQRGLSRAAVAAAIFAAGCAVGTQARGPIVGAAEAESTAADRVFELRTYTAPAGKLDALDARFREHSLAYLEKHGMTNIGYWIPIEEPGASNTLVYLLAHDSRESARESWAAFNADPGWREVSRATQVDGPIVSGVESVFLRPTDYSPIQ